MYMVNERKHNWCREKRGHIVSRNYNKIAGYKIIGYLGSFTVRRLIEEPTIMLYKVAQYKSFRRFAMPTW